MRTRSLWMILLSIALALYWLLLWYEAIGPRMELINQFAIEHDILVVH
jgi:hypothetical protein